MVASFWRRQAYRSEAQATAHCSQLLCARLYVESSSVSLVRFWGALWDFRCSCLRHVPISFQAVFLFVVQLSRAVRATLALLTSALVTTMCLWWVTNHTAECNR